MKTIRLNEDEDIPNRETTEALQAEDLMRASLEKIDNLESKKIWNRILRSN